MKNLNSENKESNIITESTTLAELIAIFGPVSKEQKTPTAKALRETAGDPIAIDDRLKVYANGYAVYDNGSGRTVIWVPDCTDFTYRFDPMKDSEKGSDIKETMALPEGFLEGQPWTIALTLIGDHRVEYNSMNRTGSRTGTRDFDSDDNGDKDGDAEDAVEKSYQNEYKWREDRVGEDPESIYIRKETRQEMLDSMTDKQRKVFVLYYFNQGRTAEIADRVMHLSTR